MAEKGAGSGTVEGQFVSQVIHVTRIHTYVIRFTTTVKPIFHSTLSLPGASEIIVISWVRQVMFETRYRYWSANGTDVSPGICNGAGCATT